MNEKIRVNSKFITVELGKSQKLESQGRSLFEGQTSREVSRLSLRCLLDISEDW